jgi:hypothetical protein
MKMILRAAAILLSMTVLISCSSINKELIRSVKNVAVVSIVFDKKVDVSSVSSGILGMVSSIAQNDKFKLDAQTEEFKNKLFKDYSSFFPFKIMDESTVINQKEYQQVYNTTQSRKGVLTTPAKYAALDLSQSDDVQKALRAAPLAEGVMLVRVYYALQKTGLEMMGVGTARVQAYCTIIVFNKTGKEVLVINQWAQSDGTLTYALGGVFQGDEVIPLAKDASEKVMISISDWLQKNPL